MRFAGHEVHHDLARTDSLPYHEEPQKSRVPPQIVGLEILATGEIAGEGHDLARDRGCDEAALEVEGLVVEPAAVKAQRERALLVPAEAVLHLVPVVEPLVRGQDRPDGGPHPPQVLEAPFHLPLLVPELLLVVEVLEAAPAADRDVAAGGGDPARRSLENLHGPRLGVLPAPPVNRGDHAISGERILDEHHESVHLGKRVPAERQIGDLKLQGGSTAKVDGGIRRHTKGLRPRRQCRGVQLRRFHPRSLHHRFRSG